MQAAALSWSHGLWDKLRKKAADLHESFVLGSYDDPLRTVLLAENQLREVRNPHFSEKAKALEERSVIPAAHTAGC